MVVTRRDLLAGLALGLLLGCGILNYVTTRHAAAQLREDTAVAFDRIETLREMTMGDDPKVTSWRAVFMGAKVTHKVTTSQGDLTEEAWCDKHEASVVRDMETYVPCETAPK